MRTIQGKVVALGSQSVGKSSIINHYIKNVLWNKMRPTTGADFFTCVLNMEDTRVVLEVWDTAGQERFKSMAPMYYRNANVALLIFDITQYDSFIQIKDWVTELHKNVEKSIVLIVIGNKTDLQEERQVNAEESRAYATRIGANYHETSVVKNEGIEDLFFDVGKELIRLSPTECDLGLHQAYEPNYKKTSKDIQRHPNISIVSNVDETHKTVKNENTCC